jgi:AcrR family transcriptional regulator
VEDPPYRRIANGIRDRITRGELRPGDRIPSARELIREHGVAIATATKALAALQEEGLTVARPGVGTLVAERRVRRIERELTRDRIVAAAITVADTDGMAETTMRRIASELGVATMSLYRHVPSKDDLVLAMIDAAIGEFALPARRPYGWRRRLEICAELEWAAFRRHPWLAPSMSLTRPQIAPNALRLTEYVLQAFDGTRLTPEERLYVQILLFSYVRGVATAFEPEAEARRETGMSDEEWLGTQYARFSDVLARNDLPQMRAMTEAGGGFDFGLEKLFRFGLGRLLDGLEVFVSRKV